MEEIQNKEELNNGILEKLQGLKEPKNKNILSYSIALIKTSSDGEISKISNILTGNLNSDSLIGLRKTIKIINNENSTIQIILYDYNYLLGRKFKYLKTESIIFSEIIAIIINIYDKKYIEHLKIILDEITNKGNVLEINENDKYNLKSLYNKKIVFLVIKSSNNFLLKLTEKTALINAKEQITSLFKNLPNLNIKYIDIDINEIGDGSNLLNEIIN